MSGRLVGVGVGPGDPDLMTLKAVKALAMADVIAYFAKAGNPGNGRGIAAAHFRAGVLEEPLLYPVTTEIPRADAAYSEALEAFYAEAAARLGRHLDQGRIVAVISEGDPLLYGSYMHLHVRLASRYPAEVIPGVTGMSGCWAAAGMPIAQGDDILCVLPGTLPEDELERRIRCRGRRRDHEARPQSPQGAPRHSGRRTHAARRLCRARHDGERGGGTAGRQDRWHRPVLFHHPHPRL